MYIGIGDGGSGEIADASRGRTRSASTRWSARFSASFPTRREHVATSTLSENGRYRIPNDNPFVVEAWRAEGDLGVRPPQSAPAELGRRSRRLRGDST